MVDELDKNLVKAGNNLVGVLVDVSNVLRCGIPLGTELALEIMDKTELAVSLWQEAVTPEEE